MKATPTRLKNHFTALNLARIHRGAANGELVLHDRAGGLFSLYCQILGCLLVSDVLKCSLRLSFITGDYRTPATAGKDWWTQFFETDVINPERKQNGKSIELPPTKKSARFAHLGVGMARHLAYKLTERIRLRPELLEEIREFKESRFGTAPMVGIHYRGTDKLLIEAERVEYGSALDALARLDPRIHFFVATDEQEFLDTMVRKFGERVVFREQHRSTDGTPVHHFDPDHDDTGYTRGKDAIIDAFLLAECHGLIRTPSNLSLASSFLNPYLPTFLLNSGTLSGATRDLHRIERAALSHS